MKKRGVPEVQTSLLKVQRVIELLKKNKKEAVTDQHISYLDIANACGIWSKQTIRNWNKKDISEEGVEERRLARGWNRLLTEAEVNIVCGYVVNCATQHKLCDACKVITFIARTFRVEVSYTWISNHLFHNHFSSYKTLTSTTLKENPVLKQNTLDEIHEIITTN